MAIPLLIALRNALGIVAVLWVLLGILNFGFLTDYLVKTSSDNLLRASFWLSLGFGSSCAIVVVLIVLWQRREGETLAELGWRRPTRPRAVVMAMGSYHGLIGFHYSVLYAFISAVIFSIVGLIFVVGQRSLTPVVIAHAMTHFFGDPELLMGLLRGAVSMGR